MNFIDEIIKKFFGSKNIEIPLKNEVKPEPQKETKIEQITKPIKIEEVKKELDTVNDGNGSKPDWSYILDNCWLDDNVRSEVEKTCNRINKVKSRYETLESITNIPWYAFAIWHLRECNLDFKACLHNGDLAIGNGKKTWNVPKDRGPFNTFEEAAIDATVTLKKLNLIKNWDAKKVIEISEKFNGLGYRNKIGDSGKIEYSPYITAGTNWSDETGKYVSDGKFDKTAKEKQLGILAILIGLGVVKENKPTQITS